MWALSRGAPDLLRLRLTVTERAPRTPWLSDEGSVLRQGTVRGLLPSQRATAAALNHRRSVLSSGVRRPGAGCWPGRFWSPGGSSVTPSSWHSRDLVARQEEVLPREGKEQGVLAARGTSATHVQPGRHRPRGADGTEFCSLLENASLWSFGDLPEVVMFLLTSNGRAREGSWKRVLGPARGQGC